MTCRDIEPLILAERDGALAETKRAALSDHVAGCPACRELRSRLKASLEAYKSGIAGIPVPDVDAAWRDLQAQMHTPARRAKKRPLAPVIWFGAPLAAAAALALVFLVGGSPSTRPEVGIASTEIAATHVPPPPPPAPPASSLPPPVSHPYDPSIIAGADFVEVGNPNASTMVYVDRESGWLVVWATDPSTPGNG